MSVQNTFLMQEVELPLVEVVADLEEAGYAVDVQHFQNLASNVDAEINTLNSELRAEAGPDFDPASQRKLAVHLYEKLNLPVLNRTKTGKAAVDKVTLERLVEKHLIVKKILRHRQLTKVKGTYCPIPEEVGWDGRYHPQYNQLGAQTGRFTVKGVIQTIPKDDEFCIRHGFIARQGFRIVAADFEQQELRVLAAVSGDPAMVHAINEGVDLHGLAAVKVFNLECQPNEVKSLHKGQRDQVKAVHFGLVYGRGANSLANDPALKLDTESAQQLIDDYFNQFPSVKALIDDVHIRVERDGYIEDPFGRRRHLPDARLLVGCKRNQKGTAMRDEFRKASKAKREAQNFIIQAASATITKLAMLRCHRRLKEAYPKARMVLTLHDELQFEVPEGDADRLAGELPELMTNLDLGRFDLKVPMAVEVKTGLSWGDLKPYGCENLKMEDKDVGTNE